VRRPEGGRGAATPAAGRGWWRFHAWEEAARWAGRELAMRLSVRSRGADVQPALLDREQKGDGGKGLPGWRRGHDAAGLLHTVVESSLAATVALL
jgi:hypothetical protein